MLTRRGLDAEGKQRAAQWPPRGPVRLLIVLDRPTMVDLIMMTLNHGVYMIRTASTAVAATALLDEWQPHLVLLDADLDGKQVVQHVAASVGSGCCLPTIAITRR